MSKIQVKSFIYSSIITTFATIRPLTKGVYSVSMEETAFLMESFFCSTTHLPRFTFTDMFVMIRT